MCVRTHVNISTRVWGIAEAPFPQPDVGEAAETIKVEELGGGNEGEVVNGTRCAGQQGAEKSEVVVVCERGEF